MFCTFQQSVYPQSATASEQSASGTPPAPLPAHTTPTPSAAPVQHEPARGAAVAERTRTTPAPRRVDAMPLWKVLLHNDDVNDEVYVVRSLIELAAMRTQRAVEVMLEAHNTGVALVCAVHRERAELFQEQFESKGLTVTIEPDR